MIEIHYLICVPWEERPNIIETVKRACYRCFKGVAVDASNVPKIDREGWRPLCTSCRLSPLIHGHTYAGSMIGGNIFPVNTPASELRRQIALLIAKKRRN